MKTILMLMLLTFMSQAFADGVTDLLKDDLSLSQASAKITNVREICPSTPSGIRCMAVGSIVTIKVTLNGCLDRFGGHSSKLVVNDGKAYLFFNSINIFNKASMVTRCIQAPTKMIQIHVPYEGEIELVNMEYMGDTMPHN